MDQRVDAAPGAAGGDAQQAPGGGLAEVHREIGDDQEVVLLRDVARLLVVFGDGGVLVAQIHLDDLLHVLVQVRQPLLDLPGLRPDAAVDELLLVIRQVHDAGEVLAEADGIHDGEVQPARGRRDSRRRMMLLSAPMASSCPRSAVSNRIEPCSG